MKSILFILMPYRGSKFSLRRCPCSNASGERWGLSHEPGSLEEFATLLQLASVEAQSGACSAQTELCVLNSLSLEDALLINQMNYERSDVQNQPLKLSELEAEIYQGLFNSVIAHVYLPPGSMSQKPGLGCQ